MKLRKWISIATLLALITATGCTPAAQDGGQAASSGSSEASGSSTVAAAGAETGKYPDLDVLDVSAYKEAMKASDFLPEGVNLSGTKEDGSKWKIAWCNSDMADESMAYMTNLSRGFAEQYGFELVEFDAQSDPQKQVDHINQAITQGCDALVLNPIDATALNEAMKKARNAGLIVVDCQMPVSDDDAYDVYCGPDDTLAGQQAASAMIEMMPDGGKVVVIEGFPGSAAQINRDAGFLGVMQSHPEYEILEIQSANWSTADAMNIMESYMSKYPEIDAVFSHFDLATLAAIQAAEGAGRANDIMFFSVDGTQGALDTIAQGGCFKMTSMQDFNMNTELQYLAALAYLNGDGDKMEKMNYTLNVVIEQDNASGFKAGWG
ncbi:sugar ABC transporter substrate-binding protein [Butyricicoccus sp.]|uniref:sugar ABC transporter substrate-binding protein n=1 Tax=Butyricicoccus sp. TaxID=2049021 RepID=UPI003F180C23